MVQSNTSRSASSVPTRSDRRRALGKYVNRKIRRLQSAYISGSSSDARGRMALLRKGLDAGAVRWLSVGIDLYSDWPRETLGDPTDESDYYIKPEIRAIATSLQVYALHQQSKSEAMAWMPGRMDATGAMSEQVNNVGPQNLHSFGHACFEIDGKQDDLGSKVTPILKQLQSMEDFPDFDNIRHRLYSLIRMMRGQSVSLDYNSFARDLYDLQVPNSSSSVFDRWAREYFNAQVNQTNAKDRSSEE